MMQVTRKVLVAALVAVMTISPVFTLQPRIVEAQSLQDQLDELEIQLAEIKKQKQDLEEVVNAANSKISSYQGEIGKLRKEVETRQYHIAQLQLEIKELEISIGSLEKQIEQRQAEINQQLDDIDSLEVETSERLSVSYIEYRTTRKNHLDMISAKDVNSYFKDSQYRARIQATTNKAMVELVKLKDQLEKDRALLQEKYIDLQRDKAVIDENKAQLAAEQKALESEMQDYYAAIYSTEGSVAGARSDLATVSDEESQKKAEAEKLRQQIFDQFNSIPAGTYVVKGTMIGRQGSTGYSTGPHVHFMVHKNGASKNPCTYLSPGTFSFCNGNSQLKWPLKGTFYFTSNYGYRCFGGSCSFHDAIDIAHGTWNAPVYAAHDGWLYKGVDNYGALYIIICQNKNSCNSGFKTGYWHLSSY